MIPLNALKDPVDATMANRRSVLLGLGASALLPAAAHALPSDPDVIVIGAGSAGLAAARTLIARGQSVVVLEAANRIGGRAHTESTSFGVPFDRGCSWLQGPADLPYVTMARDWGFTLLDHDTAGEALFVGDQRASHADQQKAGRAWGAAEAALDAAGAAGRDVAAASVMPTDQPFIGIPQTWMGPMDFAVDFADLSTMDVYSYGTLGANYLVREGYGTLVARMGQDLPVQLETPATRIDWSGDGVRIETPRGTLRARACIVTVSTGVLATDQIRFTPALPDWKTQAVADVPMGLLTKVGLEFDGARFGLAPNDWLTYWVGPQMPARACYFLSFPFDVNLMVGFIGGAFGWEMARAGEAATVDFALGELAKIFGSDVRKHFVRGVATDWVTNPLTLGAYAAARPGRHAARAVLSRPVGNRIFFAGEALAGPYIQLCGGAFLSGQATANAVAASLGCDSCTNRKQRLKKRDIKP